MESKDQPSGAVPPLHASTSEAVTRNVRVEVESQYAPEHSQPFQNEWFFYYTIRITNEGDETVQLLGRHWICTRRRRARRRGQGPRVSSASSRCSARASRSNTPRAGRSRRQTALLRGTYQMVDENGGQFDVEIAPFALHEPYTVH